MNETGLVVVHNTPIESTYSLAPNGLFLPKSTTFIPPKFLAQSSYPEFALALVKEWDAVQAKYFKKPSVSPQPQGKVYVKNEYEDDSPKGLAALVPNIQKPGYYQCPLCYDIKVVRHMPTISGLIVHMNDDHKATREYIADHLDTLNIDLRIRKVA